MLVAALVCLQGIRCLSAAQSELRMRSVGADYSVQVLGDSDDEWRFQSWEDLRSWMDAPALSAVFSARKDLPSVPVVPAAACQFLRAVRTDGLFDTNLPRTLSLTFTNSNWATLLANARLRSSNVPCSLALDNGVTVTNVGARYKGNTSYDMGGAKKSVNLDINYADAEARVMGYRAIIRRRIGRSRLRGGWTRLLPGCRRRAPVTLTRRRAVRLVAVSFWEQR
jgi:hypothetical protein